MAEALAAIGLAGNPKATIARILFFMVACPLTRDFEAVARKLRRSRHLMTRCHLSASRDESLAANQLSIASMARRVPSV